VKIPTNCPYSIKPPPRDEEPLCRTMWTETEVYRLTWRSKF
jgi:hypothetical protein